MHEKDLKKVGTIFFKNTNNTQSLIIDMYNHTYEIREEKFKPIMEKFSLMVDGKFAPSVYDSLDRLLTLDEISKSKMCSERENQLSEEITELKRQLEDAEEKYECLQAEKKDLVLILKEYAKEE